MSNASECESPIRQDRAFAVTYRVGMMIQALGLAVLAVLYPLESPFYTVGIMVFEIGVLLCGIFVAVRMRWIKVLILAAILVGVSLQIAGAFAISEEYAATAIIAGVGLVCAGSGGMAAKEAYCFGFWEGWVLVLAGFPFVVLWNLISKENVVVNSLGFSGIFLLLLSLAGKKLKQPIRSA